MDKDTWLVVGQFVLAVFAAFGTVTAFVVAAKDRKNARDIARTGWDRQALVRLVELAGRKALSTPTDDYVLEIRGLLAGLGGDRVPAFRAYEGDYGKKERDSIRNGIPTLQKDILRELRAELDALRPLE